MGVGPRNLSGFGVYEYYVRQHDLLERRNNSTLTTVGSSLVLTFNVHWRPHPFDGFNLL